MDITAKAEGPAWVVSLAGHLDMAAAAEANSFFDRQMQAGQVNLVADLSQVVYLSSASLRVLLAVAKEARRRGGDMRLAAVQSDEVNKVLRMSGFSNILKVYPDTAQAAASFAA